MNFYIQVKLLHDWLKSWDEKFLHSGQKGKGKKQADGGAKKAVLLSGSPGIGKTTTAKVVSQMLGLQAIEVLLHSCILYLFKFFRQLFVPYLTFEA